MHISKNTDIKIKISEREIEQMISDKYIVAQEWEQIEFVSSYPSLGEYNFKIVDKYESDMSTTDIEKRMRDLER